LKKDPTLETDLRALVESETAGSPTSEQKWVRSSLRRLSERLQPAGHCARPPTVSRLLKKHRYSLKVNVKQKEAGAQPLQRDEQFRYIETQKQTLQAAGCPIIRVDTQKKELIGEFNNAGQAWCQSAERVLTHDFPQDALGRAVPYGLYDLRHNAGFVYVGCSADTSEFAVEAIARWWEQHAGGGLPAGTATVDSGRQWRQ
jgi:hypothetical protein